jgi:hypothetical protein
MNESTVRKNKAKQLKEKRNLVSGCLLLVSGQSEQGGSLKLNLI